MGEADDGRGPAWSLGHETVAQMVKVLGYELRRRRKESGMTRASLRARLRETTGQDISIQTLATYELGTRSVTLERLIGLCIAQGFRLSDLVSTVEDDVLDGDTHTLTVDLRTIVTTTADVSCPRDGRPPC
ncbi:MAG TPA: helix-turn-helix transcriptional regulator [Actinophytocola sp.]|jgi:transcriptional regulator with XRE-family HTH domain|nr:helix-turn-helix transcriptional regulator [Actinophytocola sp.]